MAEQMAGNTQTKMKRLSREMRNLRGKTSLPIHMASSIFVRHDTDRMDKVRAMITGNCTARSCDKLDMSNRLARAQDGSSADRAVGDLLVISLQVGCCCYMPAWCRLLACKETHLTAGVSDACKSRIICRLM